ncbi:hypothetical protein DL771_012143 [Monosporascus sp. 5C6A]|nr:hypothetical protein DL771_012143 [Monosporascus sp. 5C6A]
MDTGPHTFLALADGVSVVLNPPNEPHPPPKPAGTYATATQADDSGRPAITVFFPQMWHTSNSDVDPLASRLKHLTLLGESRPIEPKASFCNTCRQLSDWIALCVRGRQWTKFGSVIRTVDNDQVTLSNVFVMGYVDDILRTPECSLCQLVSTALEEAFGDQFNIPLSYETPKGSFRQECALHCYKLVRGGQELDLSIALSSSDSVVLPMSLHMGMKEIGLKYLPRIKLLADDLPKLPNLTPYAMEAAKRIHPGQADIIGALDAFNNCKAEHGAICEAKRSSPKYTETGPASKAAITGPDNIPDMLLVDVQTMCVVTAPIGCLYFTLSYVWGKEPFLKLTRENYSLLTMNEGLANGNLPQTFVDAIHITRLFGERYLWIDALCIMQDDEARKQQQILSMDAIYEGSNLTIIAADGESPSQGLSGLAHRARDTKQTVKDIGGLRFAVMSPPLMNLLESSQWNNRGWTYQEAMLSKRILLFTHRQLYYHCNLASFSEDMHFVPGYKRRKEGVADIENHPLYQASHMHSLRDRREFRLEQHWFSYGPLVEDFSPKQFSHESDVLKAIVGILRTMTDTRMEKYVCGVPTSIFEWALLWQPLGPIKRRSCASTGYPFPSWSWIGWVGDLRMPHYWYHPGSIFPVIDSWIFLCPSPGAARSAGVQSEDVSSSATEYTKDEVHRYLLPYRPQTTPIKQAMPFRPTHWQIWDKIPKALNSNNAYFRDDTNRFLDRITRHTGNVEAVYPLIESGVLDFMTTGTSFFVDKEPLTYTYKGFRFEKTACYRILQDDTWVGTVHLPRETAADWLKQPRTEAEFILISETYWNFEEPPRKKVEPGLDYGQWTFDTAKFEHTDIAGRKVIMENVMWIRRQPDRLAYRVCTGQIHMTAWKQAKLRKMRIMLA